MKVSTNKKELKKLDACESGLNIFVEAHGDRDVLFSECLESNGWDDVWWFLRSVYNQISDGQRNDLRLLICDWAESVLHFFEEIHPGDKRPRKAIEAGRAFAKGEIDDAARFAAWVDAETAARDAANAAVARTSSWTDAETAAKAAAMASKAAALAATGEVVREQQINDLKNLFLKWESQVA